MARRQTAAAGMNPRTVRGIRVRVALLALAFIPMFGLLFARAVKLQVIEGSKLANLARDQYMRHVALPGRRGAVYDRRGVALAASLEVDSIFGNPSEIVDQKKTARDLASSLKLDPVKLEASLSASKHFAWIKRQVSSQEVAAIKALNLPGIGFVKEPRRFFPQRELAAHLLGFSSVDGEGLEGVEAAYDSLLKGKARSVAGLRDARGRSAIIEGAIPTESVEGASVWLTIDKAIQYLTEKVLAAAVAKANAASGSAVVLDPTTGELLALANVPTFNPNDPTRFPKQALRNKALSDQFEPGSTFKIFTIAGALDKGVIKPSTTFFCEGGRYAIGKHAIHDHGGYSELDVGRIVQVSSNIGTSKIAEKLGREQLQATQRAFGFGERPGTGLNGEAKGALPFPRSNIALATQSFGQGVTASAVQIAAAFGAIANGGQLMRPYVVSRVSDPDGDVLLQNGPEKVRQVVSPVTASEMLRMMRLVVEKNGTAPLAKMDEYEVGGKTGTAQKADPATGGYSVDKRTASFVGIVPADAPRLVILVVIDEPKGDVYGGLVAAPAFKEIASGALAHLGVPPSASSEKKLLAKVESEGKSAGATNSAKEDQATSKPVGAQQALKTGSAVSATDGFIEDDEENGQGNNDTNAVVPDVQGLNARAAVKILSAANLEPFLVGSGKASSQTPSAGTAVKKGARVSVRLESRL